MEKHDYNQLPSEQESEWTSDRVNEWIHEKGVSLVGEYRSDTAKRFIGPHAPFLCLFFLSVDWTVEHRDGILLSVLEHLSQLFCI